LRVNVAVVIVERDIASLKVAVIALLRGTPPTRLMGSVELTVGAVVSAAAADAAVSGGAAGAVVLAIAAGAVVSGVAPVVKLHTNAHASALQSRSLTPVVIVAVNVVLGARLAAGVKVATL
jgi:hypothetical protein